MADERRGGLGCWGTFFIACLAVLFMRTCCANTCADEPCKVIQDLNRRLTKVELENQKFRSLFLQIAGTTKVDGLRELIRSLIPGPYHDNCASMVPEACQECMVGDSERELRVGLREFKRWIGSSPDAGLIGNQRCNITDKLRALGLLAEETP